MTTINLTFSFNINAKVVENINAAIAKLTPATSSDEQFEILALNILKGNVPNFNQIDKPF